MPLTLQIVDDVDLATILWDWNDPTGTNNATYASSVKTMFGLGGSLQLNSPNRQFMRFEPLSADGGVTVHARAGITATSWRQRIYGAASYEAMTQAVGWLSHLLAQGCVIKWQPDGQSTPRYWDVHPSQTPALLSGKEVELLQVISQLDTPAGVDIQIDREPFMRGVVLEPGLNVLTNATLLVDADQAGRPDEWTLSSATSVTEAIDAAEEAWSVTTTTGAVRTLTQDTAAASAAVNDVWTLSFEVRAVTPTAGQKIRPRIEWLTSAPASISFSDGTLTLPTTTWQRLSVTGTAPATTDRITAHISINNDDASSYSFLVRNAQLEESASVSPFRVGVETVPVDISLARGKALPVYVQGSAPAPVVITAKMNTAATVQKLRVGARSNFRRSGDARLGDYLNYTKHLPGEATGGGWTVALSNDTAAAAEGADAAGSGSNVGEISPDSVSEAAYVEHIRWTRTARLRSLRGRWRIYARMRATSSLDTWDVGLRWAPSTSDPVSNVNPVLTTPAGSTSYFMGDLGEIELPDANVVSMGGAAFELWAGSDYAGAGRLLVDYLWMFPLDGQVGTVVVPEGGQESWVPADLVGGLETSFNPAGLSNGTIDPVDAAYYMLDATNEALGVPPVAGLAWPVGRHTITWHFAVHGTGPPDFTFDVRIRNINDSTDDLLDSFDEGIAPVGVLDTITSTFDSAAGKNYQPQVVMTARTLGNLRVWGIDHHFTPYIAANEQMRMDAGSVPSRYNVEKLDSSDQIVQELAVEEGTVPIVLPPGLSILCLDALEIPGTDSENARVMTVSAEHAPRYPV